MPIDDGGRLTDIGEPILHGFRQLLASELVKALGAHSCRSECNTSACGWDAGACFDGSWCAPACSPSMNNDQTCDPECFTAACGWDSPACDQCDVYVGETTGIYAGAVTAAAAAASSTGDDASAGGPVGLWVVFGLSVVLLVLRVRTSILAALEGDPRPHPGARCTVQLYLSWALPAAPCPRQLVAASFVPLKALKYPVN
eukprot:SAG22_NODE_128_length_18787_cov_19.577108_6_plen_200_part_00